MNSVNEQPPTRMRRRDRLRSFAHSTSSALRQEINRYYSPPRPRSIASSEESNPEEIKRIDEFLEGSVPEIVQPQCMLFPTYAKQVNEQDGETQWKMTLGGWTFAKPGAGRLDRWLLAAGRTYGGLSKDTAEDNHFAQLLNQFRCQTMKMIDIQLKLPGVIAERIIEDHEISPENQQKMRDFGALVNSGASGRFEKEILLDTKACEELKEHSKYLTVEALFDQNEQPFSGYVDLIHPHGISVISDIDDTIKVTDILDGKDAILQNTFFRTAREVSHMPEVYRSWATEGAHLHYVSNSPWQVYPALSEFFKEKQFPRGSVHLRTVSTSDIIIGGRVGKHKLDTIERILTDFPQRKFILVGDSGEMDPEIYQQMYMKYPDQIIKIFIHDVTSQRAVHADRRAREKPDSYYKSVRRFISREGKLLGRGSASQLAMDAMAQTEIPKEQQDIGNPDVPLKTKLEQFHDRMERISSSMCEGVFTVFTLASQLMLDPIVAEEFLMSKTEELSVDDN